MHCNRCKKDQETITIAGKTYCASCSTLLKEAADSGQDSGQARTGLARAMESKAPKHKTPKLETTDNEIRTERAEAPQKKEDPAIRELSRETKIPEVNKDELEGSAILLDILSDDAKEAADKKTIAEDKKLEEASGEILNILAKNQEEPTTESKQKVRRDGNGTMNDIVIGKRKDYLNKKHREVLKTAEKEIKDEAEKLSRVVISEKGYTKEYDIMILSITLTAAAMVILAIFLTFK